MSSFRLICTPWALPSVFVVRIIGVHVPLSLVCHYPGKTYVYLLVACPPLGAWRFAVRRIFHRHRPEPPLILRGGQSHDLLELGAEIGCVRVAYLVRHLIDLHPAVHEQFHSQTQPVVDQVIGEGIVGLFFEHAA